MKDNIALIGFMGSGKSTVGKILSKSLDMKFVDIDKLISSYEKKSINDIFAENGEIYFRNLELKTILEKSIDNNVVISTGGGVVIDNENIKNLQKTSFIVYLNCDIETLYHRLKNSKTRPILNGVDDKYFKIKELLEKREFLYRCSADFIVDIDINSNILDTVEKIKNAYINS